MGFGEVLKGILESEADRGLETALHFYFAKLQEYFGTERKGKTEMQSQRDGGN